MPTYRVTDNQTGQTYRLTGDSPPTQQELESIFSANREPQRPQAPTTSESVPENKPGFFQSIARGASNIFSPRSLNLGQQISSSRLINRQLPGIQERQQQGFDRSRQLIQQAKNETDPIKKQRLLALSRQMDQDSSTEIESLMGDVQQRLGKTYDQYAQQESPNSFLQGLINPAYLRQGLGVGAEIGSYIAPQAKVFKGGGAMSNIGNAAISAGGEGLMMGLTDPTTQSVGETVGRGVQTGLAGATTGAAFASGGELLKSLAGARPNRFQRAVQEARETTGRVIDEGEVSSSAVKTYLQPFRLGSKKLQKRLRPNETAEMMIKYGNTGSMGQQFQRSQTVNNVMTDMVNDAAYRAGVDVDGFQAITRAGGYRPPGVDPDDFQDIMTDLTREMSRYQGGPVPGRLQPLDALEVARYAQRQGAAIQSGMPAYSLPKSKDVGAAEAYFNFHDAIMDQIDDAARKSGSADLVKTPQRMEILRAMSPRFADEVEKATTVQELRSLFAPWVRSEQMATETMQHYGSPLYNMAENISNFKWMNPLTWAPAALENPQIASRAAGMMDTLANAQRGTGQAVNRFMSAPGVSRVPMQSGAIVAGQMTNPNEEVTNAR